MACSRTCPLAKEECRNHSYSNIFAYSIYYLDSFCGLLHFHFWGLTHALAGREQLCRHDSPINSLSRMGMAHGNRGLGPWLLSGSPLANHFGMYDYDSSTGRPQELLYIAYVGTCNFYTSNHGISSSEYIWRHFPELISNFDLLIILLSGMFADFLADLEFE